MGKQCKCPAAFRMPSDAAVSLNLQCLATVGCCACFIRVGSFNPAVFDIELQSLAPGCYVARKKPVGNADHKMKKGSKES